MKALRGSFLNLLLMANIPLLGVGPLTVEHKGVKATVTLIKGKAFVRYPVAHAYYREICACADGEAWTKHYVTIADSCVEEPVSPDDVTLFQALILQAQAIKEKPIQ